MNPESPNFHNAPARKERISLGSIHNYSGLPVEKVISYFPSNLRADKIVVMPDLNPGRTKLPSGCSVEIDTEFQPNWREFLLSDIGCGMQVLRSSISWDEFEDNVPLWENLYDKLKLNKGQLGDLGSGNHFLDATVDDDEHVYFVVHTGSRNESAKAEPLVDKPEEFDKAYQEIQNWAKSNRDTVAQLLKDTYGSSKFLFDQPHNTFSRNGEFVTIYKGTVNLKPGELSLIPSSMDTDMVIVEGGSGIEMVNNTVAHGTGRYKSRGEAKEDAYKYDFEALRRRIHIPDAISNSSILTENPSCYKDLDSALARISDLITVKKRLHPIAYIGQI